VSLTPEKSGYGCLIALLNSTESKAIFLSTLSLSEGLFFVLLRSKLSFAETKPGKISKERKR